MRAPRCLLVSPVAPCGGGNGLAMRAELVRTGLARFSQVSVLVIPVFEPDGAAPGSCSAPGYRLLSIGQTADSRADLTQRLGTATGRQHLAALFPTPTICRTATMSAAREVAAAADDVDLVYVLRSYLLPFLDVLLDQPDRPRVVVDVDDVDSITERSFGHDEEADRFQRLEEHYLPIVDHVVVASTADADGLAERCHLGAVSVVPNAVHPPEPTPPAPEAGDLLLVGNLSYGPNIDAAAWLCARVLPLLDGVTVAIVGSNPAPAVWALAADSRVCVAADVAEVTPWYAGARLAVVPLRCGGGTPTKVIEALAQRTPVVTTPYVAARFRGTPIEACLTIGDAPAAFAAACARLIGDRPACDRLAERGYREFARSASVPVVARAIEQLMGHILVR